MDGWHRIAARPGVDPVTAFRVDELASRLIAAYDAARTIDPITDGTARRTRRTKSDDPAEEKVYRTGSHVPVKDKSAGSSSVTTSTAPTPGMPSPYVPGKGGGQ